MFKLLSRLNTRSNILIALWPHPHGRTIVTASTASSERVRLPQHGRSWTAEDDEVLIKGRSEGLPADGIAAKLKRTISAIESRSVQIYNPGRIVSAAKVFTPDDDDLIVRRIQAGQSCTSTAKDLNCRSEIIRHRFNHHLARLHNMNPILPKGFDPAKFKELVTRRLEEGHFYAEIAAELKMPPTTFWRYCRSVVPPSRPYDFSPARNFTPVELEVIKTRFTEGVSIAAIAKGMKRSWYGIHSQLAKDAVTRSLLQTRVKTKSRC